MSNAIGSSRESNPSRRISHLRAVPLGHAADEDVAARPWSCILVLLDVTAYCLQRHSPAVSRSGTVLCVSVYRSTDCINMNDEKFREKLEIP